MEHITQQIFSQVIINLQVADGCILANPAVDKVLSLVGRNHILDVGLYIHLVVVGINHGSIVGAARHSARTEGCVHLQFIHTVGQSFKRLVHVEGGSIALGRTHLAIGAIASGHLTLPAVESIGEVAVYKKRRKVSTLGVTFRKGGIEQIIDKLDFGTDLLRGEHMLLIDVAIRTIGQCLRGFDCLHQVRLQQLATGTIKCSICIQEFDGLLHLGKIVGIGPCRLLQAFPQGL